MSTKEFNVSGIKIEEGLNTDPNRKTPERFKRKNNKHVEINPPSGKRNVTIVLPTEPHPVDQCVKKRLLNSLIKNIILNVITSLCFQLIQFITLVCLGRADTTLLQINAAKLGHAYINTFGFTFCIGSLGAFELLATETIINKNYEMLHLVYNQAKIFSILVFLIFLLPLCYISDYTLIIAGINKELSETAGNYVRYNLIAMFLAILNQINFKFLQMLGHYFLAMFINIIVILVHTIACVCFIVAFKLGVEGAGIAMIFTYLLNYIISSYFLTKYNPCEVKDVFELDTESLSSSTFYYYVKIAFPSGTINSINYIVYDFTIFSAAYLSPESLCANVILLSLITITYLFVYCFTSPFLQNLTLFYQGKEKAKTLYNIKSILLIAIVTCSLISVMIFFFSYDIAYIFVNDNITAEYVGNVIKWYSIFIFFDWGKTIFNSSIRGLSKNSSMDLICSLILLFIFLPLGLLMTFSFKLGYKGFWYSNYISMVLLTTICGLYFFSLESENASLKRNTKYRELNIE